MTVKIKPDRDRYGIKVIHKDNNPVGEYHFLRDKRDRNGRVEVTHKGEHTDYKTGKKHSLNMFGWEKDVQKHLRHTYEHEAPHWGDSKGKK